MKVTNWRKKFFAALLAAGLLSPAAVRAAGLNVNLVTNGDFEHVNLSVTGSYNAPLILDWTGPNIFAYSHDASITSAGVVPDYADGANPPGALHWYFTANNAGSAIVDVHDPNTYFQDVDVSTGPTAAAISAGQATYGVSAYMSSYLNDADIGHVRFEFRNSASVVLASAQLDDADFGPNNVWSQSSQTGAVPLGTTTVRVSLWGTRTAGGAGADGYIDNVDFRISQVVPEPSTVGLLGACASIILGLYRPRR